jgi:hypothetical protein
MTAAAQRQARRRQRRRNGRVLLVVEADEVALIEALIAAQLLDPLQADDKAALKVATERLLQLVGSHA